MADEATVTATEATTTTTEAGSGVSEGIKQDIGNQIPEAFASWMGVDKTEAKPEEKKAEPPKDSKQETTGIEKKTEEKPDVLMSAFTKDGTFDLEGFSRFAAPVEQPIPVEKPAPSAQAAVATKQEPEKPEWEKRLEEEREYTTNLRNNIVGWASAVRSLIAQGASPEDAIAHVENQLAQNVDSHLQSWKAQREFNFKKEEQERSVKEKTEKEEQAAIPVRSKTNMGRIISSLPGKTENDKTTLFNEVLFGKDVGAHILDFEFRRLYPGVDQKPPEEQKKLAEKFINGICGDYRTLSFYFDRAMDRAARMNLPKLNQRIAAATEAAINANRLASQKRPGGTAGRPAQQETRPADKGWADYFGSPEKMADRIN